MFLLKIVGGSEKSRF